MNHFNQEVYNFFILSLEAAVAQMQLLVSDANKRQQAKVEGGASFKTFYTLQQEIQQLRKAARDFERVLKAAQSQDPIKFVKTIRGTISKEVANGVSILLYASYEKVKRDSKRSA